MRARLRATAAGSSSYWSGGPSTGQCVRRDDTRVRASRPRPKNAIGAAIDTIAKAFTEDVPFLTLGASTEFVAFSDALQDEQFWWAVGVGLSQYAAVSPATRNRVQLMYSGRLPWDTDRAVKEELLDG